MRSYTYSAYLWPSLILTAFIASLAWYGWRRRNIVGALPFAIGCLFGVAWSIGSMLEIAAVDPDTKIFWMKFATLWQLPVVTSATCFVLQYAGLGRWLNRRTLILLSIPPLAFMVLVLTDGLHHLGWTSFSLLGGNVRPVRAVGVSTGLYYSYLLSLVNIGVLVGLFVRSPRHRSPVALMLQAQVGARALFELGTRTGFAGEADFDPLVLGVVFGFYAVALFGFHVFNPIPAARAAALGQMHEGMLVLDLEGKVVDANPAAERTLGEPATNLRGRMASGLLPVAENLAATLGGGANGRATAEAEFELGSGLTARHYRMGGTPLNDRHGEALGYLLLLHDVTEQKRAQARLLEQERAVATLQERERLARELHDSVGQVLGYISLQAQTIQKWLRDGDGRKASSLLDRLSEVAQDAHADVRESILALRAGAPENVRFLPTIGSYLEDFEAHYGIRTELCVAERIGEDTFDPVAAAQLVRVVQEALTNARRHGDASTVRVLVDRRGDRADITVVDDGCGFDLARLSLDSTVHFGLTFMRERMGQIGGSVQIDSRPGAGTTVRLEAPIQTA